MPSIYLSPSTQENNLFVNGGTEEYYMNLIADAMIPYLEASGIQYTRNTPNMTAASSIRASNAGNYDLHLAIHSNAAPEGQYGSKRGSDVYYYPRSRQGFRAATIFANNLREIYPLPNLVRTVPTTTIGEVTRTRAPSVFLELAYHDNINDANWIKNNIQNIAANLVVSLTDYFGIPFVSPQTVRQGRVNIQSGNLNLRAFPNVTAPIKAKMPNGAQVTVYSRTGDWYVVGYNYSVGYALARYITIV